MGSSGLLSIDLGLRGAAVGLSLLLAAVALRDRRDSTVARLGAALTVGAAASAICSAPTFPRSWPWWSLFLLALSSGGPVVFWLWARAAFDDDFVLRRWHGALWAAMAGIELFVASGIVQWPVPDWRSTVRCRLHLLGWLYWLWRRRLRHGGRIWWKDGGGCGWPS